MDDTTPQITPAPLGDRYLLEELIGEGAFARTYRARDTRLGRVVAVKLLRSHYAADASFLDRFHREARSAARVDHPNVVHVYDYGEQDGVHYLVLQYVPGRDLKQVVEERAPLPTADAIAIAREILSGLAAIHAAGIIHRDIKPQNVLIGRDGVSRVSDFGIAYESRQSRLIALTNHGETLGTPAYMAPEQARGEPVSEATDLYAVGVVLFEMLTGRLPFQAESALGMMVAHVEQAPPSPSFFRPGIPAGLDAVVVRALAKAPRDRFASARDMERALADSSSRLHDGVPAAELPVRPTRVRAAALPGSAQATVPLPVRTPPPERSIDLARDDHRRRSRSGWIAPALIALVAIAALFAALVRAGGGDDERNTRATSTATRQAELVFATDTPAAEPTSQIVSRDSDPTSPPQVTRTPTPLPAGAGQPEPTAGEGVGGAPTIAPSNGETVADTPDESGSGEPAPVSLEFSATDWQGGFTRSDPGFLGRPWTAVYGAQSGYGEASLTVSLDAAPAGEAELTITGVDDEAGGDSPISIAVNGVEIFSGPSPFPSWDGADESNAPWTAVSFTLPPGLLREGNNEIRVANLDPSGNIDSPPYVLLSDASLTAS